MSENPRFIIENGDNSSGPDKDARGRPQISLQIPRNSGSLGGYDSEEDDANSANVRRRSQHLKLPSPLSSRGRRRSNSQERSRSPSTGPTIRGKAHDVHLLDPLNKAMKRMSATDELMDPAKSPDLALMNELTLPDIDDLKADLATALGTPNMEGTWLPMKHASANSSSSNISNNNDIPLQEFDSNNPFINVDLEAQRRPSTSHHIHHHQNKSSSNLKTPTHQKFLSPASPSKTIEDVIHGLTTRARTRRLGSNSDNQSAYSNSRAGSDVDVSSANISEDESRRNGVHFEKSDDENEEDDDYENHSQNYDANDFSSIDEDSFGRNPFTDPQPNTPTQRLKLYGNSLFLFGPTSKIRNRLARVFLKTWPYHLMRFLLFAQTALLAFRQWDYNRFRVLKFGFNWQDWVDWVLLVINIVYTIDMTFRMIAFGCWDDSQMFQAIGRHYVTIKETLGINKLFLFFVDSASKHKNTGKSDSEEPLEFKRKTLKHSITIADFNSRNIPTQRAYLRSSWNRIDFFSTISYWIEFFLTVSPSNSHNVSLFRALACIRIIKLVDITDRISLILKSLKFGASQLVDVSLFLIYFWVLFAIIGVQSFKSSLRRTCVWTNPSDPTDTYSSSNYCGGWLEPGTLKHMPYLFPDGTLNHAPKGFLCPVNSKCVVQQNPYGGTVSFDNVIQSLQLTFVVMSANTFTDLMYYTMDTDSMAASLFYIFGIFFLYLWLINLIIAVISSSFKATRELGHKKSGIEDVLMDLDLDWGFTKSIFSRIYLKFKWLFELAIFADLIINSTFQSNSTAYDIKNVYHGQVAINMILLGEIILRFFLYYGRFANFFKMKRNIIDLVLAIITCIIIIPSIHDSLGRNYEWLMIFQILRIYRVVLLFKSLRKLWVQVWRSIETILNLALFYFLLLFLSSIIYSIYFQGFIDEEDFDQYQFPLQNLPNTFVALYTITSTENWSEVMYDMQENAPSRGAGFFGACLFIAWFLLSNSVILNIFIAIIADSLEISERFKRKEQVRKFVLVDFPKKIKNFAKKTILSQVRDKIFKTESPRDNQTQVLNLLLNGAAIQNFLQDELNEEEEEEEHHQRTSALLRFFKSRYKKIISKGFLQYFSHSYNNPFFEENENQLMDSSIDYSLLPTAYQIMKDKADKEKEKFLQEHPTYNNVFYILPPNQPLRKLCQKITGPSVGKRYNGYEPNRYLQGIFLSIVAASTLTLVVVACYNTPLYKKKNNFDVHLWNWTSEIEIAFAFLFSAEFLIKIIADGLIFTPNAYFLNSWNYIDFAVLISLWVNVIALLKGYETLSRLVRGVKALRALRLLTISSASKDIFHKVVIAGVWKIVEAAFLSFTLLYPFAVWGLNLFAGRLGVCNDSNFGYEGCINEFSSQVENWNVLMPRAYEDPQLELNTYSSALLTLFEILSLEGWVDLLGDMTSSSGIGTVPSFYATPANAIFIIAFNFLGIVFVLTLFVSVIISNYSRTTGSAFMTLQQRSWSEVLKLLSQIKPTKRPNTSNFTKFRSFCYNYTVKKNVYVRGTLITLLWIHILAILLEMYPSIDRLDDFRYVMFLISSAVFTIFITLRIIAIGPKLFFINKWNIYQVFVFYGAFITSLISFFVSRTTVFANINKLFLVGIFTVLIPLSDRLSHLLKVGSASLPSFISLIYAWFILFLVFAIALNQIFGLTRLGPNTTGNLNLRTVTKSLLLLFRCSFGESWNYIMKDFAVAYPFCSEGEGLSNTDCGREQYAYILFIAWNILSMYIFVNMFISLIFDNFSYVYSDNTVNENDDNDVKYHFNREQIRKFKIAWSKYDPYGEGYIKPIELPKLLRELDGYFSFKVFEGEWTVPELTKKWITKLENPVDPYDVFIDFAAMNKTLSKIDLNKVKKRKKQYERFIEEAHLQMELNEEPGISFERIILQIPLYSKFDETNCLSLSDYMDRLLLSKKIEKRLKIQRTIAVLKMVVDRWRFLHRRDNLLTRINSEELSPISSQNSSLVIPQIIYNEYKQEGGAGTTRDEGQEGDDFRFYETKRDNSYRDIAGSLEIPNIAVQSPTMSTPVEPKFSTNDTYWSPSRPEDEAVSKSQEFTEDESYDLDELSQLLNDSEWGNYFKSVDSEQQRKLKEVIKKKEEKKKERRKPKDYHHHDANDRKDDDDNDDDDESISSSIMPQNGRRILL